MASRYKARVRRIHVLLQLAPVAALLAVVAAGAGDARRPPLTWGAIITDRDRTRLRDWRTQWVAALTRARAQGAGTRIDAEGDLLKPDATLSGEPAPDGDYRCRLVKVGAINPALPAFLVQDGLHCRIVGHSLLTLDGSQRPNGRLYPLDTGRQLFLGALTLGDEEDVMRYRRDPDRNVLGLFDRVGPQTWRLAMPAPRWQTMLDVLELRPAAAPAAR